MLLKLCARCGCVVAAPARYCPACQVAADEEARRQQMARARRYSRRHEQRNAEFYRSKGWETLRLKKLQDTKYRCEDCVAEGFPFKENPQGFATEVHHEIPVSECPEKQLDYNNLRSVCIRHHNKRHKRFGNEKAED